MEPELGKLGFGKMNSSLESSDLEKGKQAWEARFQIGEAELRLLDFSKRKPSMESSVSEKGNLA